MKPFEHFIDLKIGNIAIRLLICKIQDTKGISSKVIGEDKHYIFFDYDNTNINKIIAELDTIQTKHLLGNMYFLSDKTDSYRIFCFSKRTFREYMQILHETKLVDESFIIWTYVRRKAILRTHTKANRQQQQLVYMMNGYEETTIPKKYTRELYETGNPILPKPIKNYVKWNK